VSALRLLDDFTPEVALLDIGLPVMDGYELGGRILQRVSGCRLIAISGYGRAPDRQRSAQAGFECHLAKPVAPGQLADVVGRGASWRLNQPGQGRA
jgi:CheY-like chemotaxis protein